ncbi:MAG: class I SAM-dependent methyltransferase [bacterium]|nr:class I SAM-dependent methyltransferase [bacterium]
MKRFITKWLSISCINKLRKIKRHFENKRNANRTAGEVFAEIYRKGKWGRVRGEFCSGSGSIAAEIVNPYVSMICQYLQAFGHEKTVVDLGCGDFEIGKRLIAYCSEYIGVDIVPDLIEKHQLAKYESNVKFLCLDIAEGQLPDGDICFLRQVLQHLSNDEIANILPKLQQYEVVFVTEHYPNDNPNIVPNKDMVHGSGIRNYNNSAVYLDKAPFNIPSSCLEMVLEVPGISVWNEYGPGVVRTYKITFTEITTPYKLK